MTTVHFPAVPFDITSHRPAPPPDDPFEALSPTNRLIAHAGRLAEMAESELIGSKAPGAVAVRDLLAYVLQERFEWTFRQIGERLDMHRASAHYARNRFAAAVDLNRDAGLPGYFGDRSADECLNLLLRACGYGRVPEWRERDFAEREDAWSQ